MPRRSQRSGPGAYDFSGAYDAGSDSSIIYKRKGEILVDEDYFTEAAIRRRIDTHVPWEWRDVICTCYRPADGSDATVCASCGKYRRWLLITCKHCGKRFVYHYRKEGLRFHHHNHTTHADDSHYRWCYDCLAHTFGIEPGDHPSDVKPKELRSLDEIALDSISFDF